MELRGKALSERLLSTLKVRAAASWGARKSFTAASITSLSFSQARQRHTPAAPKTFFMASKAPSMSQSSFRGST